MKTLYININGENIQNTNDIFVVGRPEDAIINKFFFELGKEILKGVVASGVTSIKKKDIVTDFKAHDEKSYNSIMEQWDTLKQELLGENPSGTRTIKLPDEYISWLKNSSHPAYAEIAKSLYQQGSSVEISLDKIYKNAIGIIVNNIDPNDCIDCTQFVINDNAATDDSAISVAIQEKANNLFFVPYEDFENSGNDKAIAFQSEEIVRIPPRPYKEPDTIKTLEGVESRKEWIKRREKEVDERNKIQAEKDLEYFDKYGHFRDGITIEERKAVHKLKMDRIRDSKTQ